jgi:chromosome segregation ATPase
MAITQEQIFEAAGQIAAAGQRPTLEAIRKITGGSYTTISPALNEWKSRQKAAAGPLREPAPQAVGERLAEVGADIWALALELANGRLTAEREALEKARAEMQAAQAEAAELADRLTAELDEARARIAVLEAAEAVSGGEARELRGQIAAATERAATAEARAGELRTELDHAHQEAHQVRAERDQAQEKVAASAGQAQTLRAELAAANGRAAEIERRADELRADLGRARQEADQARAEQQKAAQASAAEREAARREAGQAREEAARLSGQLGAHQELLARLTPAESKPAGKKGPGQAE